MTCAMTWAMPGTGASAPAITSAAATRKGEERRECGIARSPEVPNADVSAGFSPLCGKKKGVGERETPLEMCGRDASARGQVWSAARHQAESSEEKRLRPRANACRSRQSWRTTHATVYAENMRRAFPMRLRVYRLHITAA